MKIRIELVVAIIILLLLLLMKMALDELVGTWRWWQLFCVIETMRLNDLLLLLRNVISIFWNDIKICYVTQKKLKNKIVKYDIIKIFF